MNITIKNIIHIFISLIISTVLISSCTEDKVDRIYGNSDLISFQGRFEFTKSSSSKTSLPSSSLKISFVGSDLSAKISGLNSEKNSKNYLYVIVDNNTDVHNRKIIEIDENKKNYKIVEGLENKEHCVELVKNNEYWGNIEFESFHTENGYFKKDKSNKERHIVFYGDSNPSGWSAWDEKDRGGDNNSEGYFTYPGISSRALNADFTNFSAGGHGITPSVNGKDHLYDLKNHFRKIHIDKDYSDTNKWSFDKKTDVVVINLGANDHYNGATKEEILSNWETFVIDSLRPLYKDSHFVMANSIGWAIGEPADFLEEFLARVNSKGEKNISFVKFPWLWSQNHAVISEHTSFAKILSEHISKQMNWEYKNSELYSSIPKNYGELANTSFTHKTLKNIPDAWRTCNEESIAIQKKEGDNYFIRLKKNSSVHQSIFSKKGDSFKINASSRSSINTESKLIYEFRNQGQEVIFRDSINIELADKWQTYSIDTKMAPENCWQINIILKSGNNTADFDDVTIELN